MTQSPVLQWRRQKHTTPFIGKKGKILLCTMMYAPAKTHSLQAPYPIVIVEFTGGSRCICQMVDWQESDLVKNRDVVLILRRTQDATPEEVISYHIKCKPL